jgi:hypothetical protein
MPAWESELLHCRAFSLQRHGLTMAIYDFVRQMLAWSILAAVLGFIGFPWGMVAYKIWHGNKDIDEELSEELLRRSWYFGWALGGIAIAFLFLDFFIVNQFELPPGPIHCVFYIGFLALAGWWALHFFSMEDFFQGLMLAVIYLYLPTFVLYLLWWLLGWNPLFTYVLSWLHQPTA